MRRLYVETTATGGTVSLIAFTAMALLAFFEFFVYRDTWMKYEYEVDKDFSRYIEMLILFHLDKLLFKPELCFTASTLSWNLTILFNLFLPTLLRTLLLIQNRLKDILKGAPTALPPREGTASEPLTGFHQCIAAYNFSHRIDHLSFGEEISGIINPLDGTEKITSYRKLLLLLTETRK
uniref:Endoplasmic reticulum-Golgi intermediate compartment protein n=1 Tax=Salmo trutta TaxID=8032 RepID=A0A674A748_SALTR